mmetsp:Transcript_10514/g.14746  ORF Transcript_10514/g.14746 Transcript_10514/m.14746 type:complete len:278 (-) Transcript_10514:302-1135(-)|eukprot:CAMPEP_0185739968 /NCGR_PEP_ID=MMETSP1171-20130828/36657_1 /TAXON_ID=374046 /ORGANISM="Helicotheca tamensis, Strain CCMP826" /LENGTH=277 /DNA_ID=CAMNT_0028411683 /DNA_START=28 /DNA_END=861 /DNA_ORIENTATION=-
MRPSLQLAFQTRITTGKVKRLKAIASTFMMMSGTSMAFSTTPTGASTQPPLRVFCYGDSLTAGTSPPLLELFPYATHLEHAISGASHGSSSSSSPLPPVQIRWRGLPGWTATNLKESIDDGQIGLRTTLRTIKQPSISLVILLAGTNDLAYAQRASDVSDAIIDMHKMCHEEGVPRTIAVGIPQSAWQAQSSSAADMAAEINNSIEKFCEETRNRSGTNGRISTYAPFPFQYQAGDAKFAFDGLHFTPEGYEALGLGLVPTVTSVLSDVISEMKEKE